MHKLTSLSQMYLTNKQKPYLNVTVTVINVWLIEDVDKRIFPNELVEEIAKYCRIISVLDFICDPNELERLAIASKSAERYEEMMELMIPLVKLNSESFTCTCDHEGNKKKCQILTIEQRNLLSVAFKNVVEPKRMSWNIINGDISSLHENKDGKSKKMKLYICNEYKKVIEMELHEICSTILDLLENCIYNKIEHCVMQNDETIVFYMKMIADYNRYLAEIFDATAVYKDKARKYYDNAFKIGKEKLIACNPTFLGVGLNYAAHLYEIAKEPIKAHHIMETCFNNAIDNAMEQLGTLSLTQYKDSTLIMQLLRDNLTLHTSENY